jgi:iron complex transport system substrate-binding protein
LLYTLAPEDLLGWPKAPSDEAKPYLATPYGDLPAYGRLTGRNATVDLDQVKGLKPDLILDVGDVDARYAALADRIQQQTGIPYVLLDGHLAKTGQTYRRLGQLLGKTDRADTLARYVDAVLNDLPAQIRRLAGHQALRFYYGRGTDGLQTGASGSINLEMLTFLDVINVADGHVGDRLTAVTAQQIMAWNPAVIVAQERAFADRIRADPSWQAVDAVKGKHIYSQPMQPFGWVDDPPSVNRLLGLQWLAKELYPGLPHTDPADTVRQFYDLFYQVKLTDAQVQSLLQSAAPKPAE